MKAIAFLITSLALAYGSRRSLRSPCSHGYYRFFAWECILALFLLNMGYWYYEPLAWNQALSWTLLTLCLVPLVLGARALRRHGRPSEARQGDPALIGFEKTTALVTGGIYRYIRHPLYSSLLLLAQHTRSFLPYVF
jgi:protein-S-isoprenylcysteine O-methyltransferase Ste14